MKVFEIKTPHADYEIHTLNPGESFPGFGGSRHALVVRKTASIVVRERSSMGLRDTEYDIHSDGIWRWIETLINLSDKEKKVAEIKATYIDPKENDK